MFYTLLRGLVVVLVCTFSGLSAVHMLQTQRYRPLALRKELRHIGILLSAEVLVAVAVALINWYLPMLLSMAIQQQERRETLCNWIVLALYALATGVVIWRKLVKPYRKPFMWTQRACRLLLVVGLINTAGVVALSMLTLSPYLMFAAGDYVVLLAAVLMRPVEDKINARFSGSAKKKLAGMDKLIRIGVTGSYGKTQTRLALATILSEKYSVLTTPPSFSSIMGMTRIINEQLTAAHRVFIAEMGAEQKGDVRAMTRLLRPQYGVLTCIGDAHIESFGSPEAIAQAKYELVQGMGEKGVAFFGSDGSYGDRLYRLCKHEKYRAGINMQKECFMNAAHIETGASGTRFELICADGSHSFVQTRLLGSYAVRSITLAAAVARKLGLSMEEIASGVEKLKPMRHHMRLMPGEINVIDDSQNALPETAAEALQVLSEFPGRRILVTGGLMDYERDVSQANYAFGTQIKGCADHVILIGPEDTRDVMRGLMSSGFPKANVRMVRETQDALQLIGEIAGKGDSVLYEGVYPDDED